MITKVTKDNYDTYQRLFSEINEKLSYTEDKEVIKDIGDYFLALGSIRDHVVDTKSDYHFLILPMDEGIFEINANTRAINVPTEFARNGVAVQGDEAAEIIYFSVDRYFDTTDLFERDILIQYELPDGGQGLVVPCNKTIDFIKDKVVFGWIIDNTITAQPGNVKFSIRFYERGTDEYDKPILKFGFGTLTATIKVNQALNIDIEDAEAIKSILTDKVQQYYDTMRSSKNDGADVIPAEPSFIDIDPDTGIIASNDTIKGRAFFTEASLDNSKKSIGELSYYFAYTGNENNANEEIAAIADYQKADVDVYNRYDIYWFTENGVKPYTKYYYNADTWEEDKEKLYYQFATLMPTKPGQYQLVAVNTTGRGVSKLEAEAKTNPWIIPFAEKVNIDIPDYIMISDETGTAVITPTYTKNDEGVLTYQWYKNDVAISEATDKTYSASTEGVYQVKVTNTLSEDNTTDTSSKNISVSLSPLQPTIKHYLIDGVEKTKEDLDEDINIHGAARSIGVVLNELESRSDEVTYQWYKGATPIVGATNNTLPVVVSGSYKVEITNTYNTFTKKTTSEKFTVFEE